MNRTLLALTVFGTAIIAYAAEPIFIPVKIDGPKHDPPNHTYWYGPFSECCSVADFDGDGDLDIAAGRNWYEAPDWIKHADFRDGARINGPETENNSEFAMDVNFDGQPDVVSSGWMRDKGAFWYENPGPAKVKTGVKWKAYRIHTARQHGGRGPRRHRWRRRPGHPLQSLVAQTRPRHDLARTYRRGTMVRRAHHRHRRRRPRQRTG